MKTLSFICLLLLSLMVVDLQAQTTRLEIKVSEPGTLSEKILDSDESRINELIVTGYLNGSDIAYLVSGTGKMSSVAKLDISNVVLIPGDEPYATVQIDKSDVGMGTTTATFYISDTYSEEFQSQSTGLGGNKITMKIRCNDLSGAFAQPDRYANYASFSEVILPKSLPEVGAYMFLYNERIANVVLPDAISGIGTKAFAGASSIESLRIPSKVTKIGDYAFPPSLSEIKTEAKFAEIGRYAFRGCKLRGNIDFSELRLIGEYAFSDVKLSGTLDLRNLEVVPEEAFRAGEYDKILFSEKLRIIDTNAFAKSSLSDVKLPLSVEKIAANSFADTPWEKSLDVCDGIIYIGDIALKPDKIYSPADGCIEIREGTTIIADGSWNSYYTSYDNRLSTKVTGVRFPSTLKRIGDRMLSGFSLIGDIELPGGLESIGDAAFKDCGKLWFKDLPSSLLTIGDSAFSGCASLTRLTLGESIYNVGYEAFKKCTGISSVEVLSKKLAGSKSMCLGNDGLDKVFIGKDVERIPDYMFYGTKNLRKIEFENRDGSVPLVLAQDCFGHCLNATVLNLPSRIDTVGYGAFNGCQITELNLTDCKYIGEVAFFNTPLTSVTIPENLGFLGDDAFWNCLSLESVNYRAIDAEVSGTPFRGCAATAKAVIGKNVKRLGAFCNFTGLSEVVFEVNESDDYEIPVSFSIEKNCFNSTAITSIQLPRHLSSIGVGAFTHSLVETLEIPSSVREIGENVFSYSSVKKVVMHPLTPPMLSGNLWDGYLSAVFYVHASCLDDYRNADIWKNYNIKPIEDDSSLLDMKKNDIEISVEFGRLKINGVADIEEIIVYNSNGVQVCRSRDNVICGLSAGLYIISVAGKAVKVVL